MKRITIIIPVYNTEKYLETCINSVLEQSSLPDEILLVDDGSTDNSGKICDQYSEKNTRIRVIHNPHKGLVATRKDGIKEATGDYISFIDSDDRVESGFIEKVRLIVKQYDPDMISFSFVKDFDGISATRDDGLEEGFYNRDEIDKRIEDIVVNEPFYTPLMNPSIVTKVVKREILSKFEELVPDEINKGEDMAVTFPLSLNVRSLYVDSKPYYHYIVRNNSMSWEKNANAYRELMVLAKHLKRETSFCAKKNHYDKYLLLVVYHYLLDNLEHIPKQFWENRENLICWSDVKRGDRVIVYGKGLFANGLINIIKENFFCELVANVDSVDAGKVLKQIEKDSYDKVIVAIADRKIVKVVNEYLKEMHIDVDKISCIEKESLQEGELPEELKVALGIE